MAVGNNSRVYAARLGGLRVALILCAGIFLQACATLPSLEERTQSSAISAFADSRLADAIRRLPRERADHSGVVPLPSGRDAFATRWLLIEAAERTLDVQYYIWRNDLCGRLLLGALERAARRGVRVRLLLDDHGVGGLDEVLSRLDAQPNAEVRLFNPYLTRRWRAAGFLFDFERLNRRMHNKSFTADNQATVVGGRNVGNEYFDAGEGLTFADLDVLAVGPVVDSVSQDFDRYWRSESAYPVERILGAPSAASRSAANDEPPLAAQAYFQAVKDSHYVRELLKGRLAFEWAKVTLVSDDPGKALRRASEDELFWNRLKRVMDVPRQRLDLVSAYFVPGPEGSRYLQSLATDGVQVNVLTNGLAATDVPAVHAGYARWRKPMLASGVRLFELKRTSASPLRDSPHAATGSSSASLHAKTFAIDGQQVFVGSFNFDPRSARLNTEMGLVIDSPVLAHALESWLRDSLRDRAYEVRLNEQAEMTWIEFENGRRSTHAVEPDTTVFRRLVVGLLSLLPIDWLL